MLKLDYYKTLGASQAQAPPSERGKLLAAENRKKKNKASGKE